MVKKPRQSNIELLRIVAMLMVLGLHATFESFGYVHAREVQHLPWRWLGLITTASACMGCVDIFVLITGWFGTTFKWKGALKLVKQTCFIALTMFGVVALLGKPLPHHVYDWFRALWSYWFVRSYLLLYLLTPVLNAFVTRSTEKQLRQWLIAFYIAFIPLSFVSDDLARGFSCVAFVGLYLLGRYLRLHLSARIKVSNLWLWLLWTLTVIFQALAIWSAARWQSSWLKHLFPVFTAYSNPLTIAASAALLLAFARIKCQSKVINWLAAGSFAAYLTHQQLFLRSTYFELMRGLDSNIASPPLFVLSVAGCIAVIYLASALLDAFRRFIRF